MNDQPPLPPPAPPPVSPAAKPHRQPSLVITCLVAGLIIFFDTQVSAMPFLSMVMLTVGNIVLLIRLVLAWGNKQPLRPRLLRIAIFSAAGLVAIPWIRWEHRRVHENALAVVAAVERFRRDEGDYPVRLQELVPRYLPAIPSARFGLMAGLDFKYYQVGSGATFKGADASYHHQLVYVSIPPFGKSLYDFEEQAWNFYD